MTATPGYIGERDLSGRQPPYVGPLFSVLDALSPGTTKQYLAAYLIPAPGATGYFSMRALTATLANEDVEAFLLADDGNGGFFEVDYFSSLQVATATQASRMIIIPPVQMTLTVNNNGTAVYDFHASLIPDLHNARR